MKQINNFLQKTFASLSNRITLDFNKIAYNLTKVAKCNSYVETFSKHSDSLHNWIKQIYEEDIANSFEAIVRGIIKKLRIKQAELAFDITHEPFYGKTKSMHIIGMDKRQHKYSGSFQYLTCCLINKGKEIPLMALPVSYGQQTKLTIDLIRFCQSLNFRIKEILFDRGFYVAELIDFLNSQKIKYCMLVPAYDGKLKQFKDSTINFASYKHEMKYSKDKSTWKPKVILIACKQILDFDWLFATNVMLERPKDYVLFYKRRWQIETNYRVEDEAKIKSKSVNYMIRYFYFVISNLFHLLWIVHKNIKFYVQFKKYLDLVEQELLYDFLQIKQI